MLNEIRERLENERKILDGKISSKEIEINQQGSDTPTGIFMDVSNLRGKLTGIITAELIIHEELKKYYETQKQK